jgi:hypothetical protein
MDKLQVVANVSERDVGQLKAGLRAVLNMQASRRKVRRLRGSGRAVVDPAPDQGNHHQVLQDRPPHQHRYVRAH